MTITPVKEPTPTELPKEQTPTELPKEQTLWSEMAISRQAAIATLPGFAEFPENATSWDDYAQHTFDELLIFDDCWFVEPATGITGYRPYVKGTDQWGGASRTREISELMAAMDVLWPMYRYLQLHPDLEQQAQIETFIAELPKYHNLNMRQTTNRPGETKHDSWYYVENSVLKWGHLYLISENPLLETPYIGSLDSAVEMAHNFEYLFPQFVNLQKQAAEGYNTQNYSTAGLLAYALIHAYQQTDNVTYLVEAEKALLAMRAVENPRELLYEPQELAAAAAAAAWMLQYTDIIPTQTDFAQLAQDFFYLQTQAMYYNEGQIDLENFGPEPSPWLPPEWRDGLFSPYYNPVESGGINAPAYKENLESVIFWADYLKQMYAQPGFDPVEPLKILNLNRIKNFYFFSLNIPDEWERDYGPNSLQYVPYEDIDYYAVREHEDRSVLMKAGYNGKEIYGAGETLWAYLLFEALGTSTDQNTLIMNLNIFDQQYPPQPEARAYIIFNPYPEEKTLTFTLKHLDESYQLFNGESSLGTFSPGASFQISLSAYESAYLTLKNSTQ